MAVKAARIRRALVSVSDKEGLLPFVQGLARLRVEILSTGGTAAFLRGHGVRVRGIAEITGFPEILGGRVKTLHPKVHAGILADRHSAEHRRQMGRLGIAPIDLVVVNLYPFEAEASRAGVALAELIEQIDIGGVALLRSAAKNFRSVGVVCRPSQYPQVLEALQRHGGSLPEGFRRRLAVEAFAETAYYDQVIHQALTHRVEVSRQWPQRLVLGASLRQTLRYGENWHQAGRWYQWPATGGTVSGLAAGRQLHGKELSFNNLLDLDAALQTVSAFRRPAAAFVKHNNPCGVACADRVHEAVQRAHACDAASAFGGVLGLNRPVDRRTAETIQACGFLECLVAPGFREDALRLLAARKSLRILELPAREFRERRRCVEFRQISGGLLAQEPDTFRRGMSRWRVPTSRKPTAAQREDLLFAWTVARFVRSNAVVIARGQQTVGIGGGQASRVDSVRLALRKAGRRARGAVLASDGFFPKPDGPQAAVRAGIRAIVQPGGSIQDPQVVRVAEQARIPMLLTGERHFRH